MQSPILFLFALIALACSPPQETAPPQEKASTAAEQAGGFDINRDERGLALRGYDAVAYHTGGQSIEGKAEHSFSWHGAQWQFASAVNRDKFSQNPEKYAPSNGGYCTFGIVLRKKFDGDPNVWAVVQDRLYIFLNEDVKGKFFQDEEGNFQKVSANWPYVQGKDAEDL